MKKKYLVLTLLFMCLFFISSCSDSQDTTRWLPQPSSIKGTLGYTANPFNSKDSVLCVNDIYRIEVQCDTKEYYTYLKKYSQIMKEFLIMGMRHYMIPLHG